MKFKNHFNHSVDEVTNFEHPVGPSMTIPDQSMSIRTILERYARGIPFEDKVHTPFYDGEEFVPNLKRMDLADIQELKEATDQQVKDLKQKARHEKKQREEAKKKAAEAARAVPPSPTNPSASSSSEGSPKKE